TVRTVLVCDDGRVMLTGLAAGAAEEALCGYAPAPLPDADPVAGPTVAGPTTSGIPALAPTPPSEFGGGYALPPARSDAGVPEYAGAQYADVQEYTGAQEYADVQEFADHGSRDGDGSREVHGSRERREGRELPVPPLPQGYTSAREDDGRDSHDPYDLPSGRDDADPVPGPWADGQEIVPRPAAPAVPY
ncbi:hypothetical protein B5180_39920, partial [Streptomyces sp. BF-3]